MSRITPLRRFKSLARKGDPLPADLRIRKQVALSDISQTGDRRLRFTISTDAIDRDADVIDPAGWDLTEYRKNPVVLYAHDAENFPVGKSVQVDVTDNLLWAEVEFISPDVPLAGPRADAVFQMCQGGFLNAASVGFHPVDFEFSSERMDDFGMDFTRQKLLEWSIVTIPSNPEALIEPPQQTDQDVAVSAEDQNISMGSEARSNTASRRKRLLMMRARAALV
ncbi:HK97 family phage prohead protease [Gluconobacter morbifer]|uniref:Prohead serine protease domain-containing protein n=1 Tax=Gluconobacter morbifer G707 TaxID=1088869 RepID=G6XIV8_9PROT|nr:HK97 family phage prohead protease [Gluconobacter morbifer]EHH68388.1 hypothetical protein GMO_11580 [Gluconobacter morbifer G707]